MSLNLISKPLSPVDEMVVQDVRKFAEEVVGPNAECWEKEHCQPEVIREAIGMFTRYYISKEAGGTGASAMTLCRVMEELARVDYGFAFGFGVHNNASVVISRTRNISLRERYLPKLMSGEMIGAFLLTEPEVGSNAAAIKTRAVSDHGKWVLNGEKAWVTNAATADLLLVFAQAGEGTKGIMGFLVERNNPGVEFVEQYDMSGAHAAVTGAFRLKDCVVDESQVVFQQGEGFRSALGAIDFARFAIAAMCNGAYMCCLETAVDYAKQRIQFGVPIYQHQALQFKLADEATKLESSRMLTFRAAKAFDDGENTALVAAHCKKYATKAAFEGAACAMQCMGSNGLKRSYPIVRQMNALTITFNTDGTNDICNVVIGRNI